MLNTWGGGTDRKMVIDHAVTTCEAPTRTCLGCGAAFTSTMGKQHYCSRKCYKVSWKKEWKKTRDENKGKTPLVRCQHCWTVSRLEYCPVSGRRGARAWLDHKCPTCGRRPHEA